MNPIRPTLLIGTRNKAKARRIRSLLENTNIVYADTNLLARFSEPLEKGSTHTEIAEYKAIYWSKIYDGLTIASDGGLLIPALGNNSEIGINAEPIIPKACSIPCI